MRRGITGKGVLWHNGNLIGLKLGFNFTAEHEWGIQPLKDDFKIDTSKIGLEGRIIQHFPKNNILYNGLTIDKKRYYAFVYQPFNRENKKKIDKQMVKNFGLYPHKEEEIQGAWDEKSFGILTETKSLLKQLYRAFEQHNVCMGLFRCDTNNPFENSSLSFLVADRIPESLTKQWEEYDKDRAALQEAKEQSGIEQILMNAGKRYYALSPAWKVNLFIHQTKSRKTEYPVVFWLNPLDQRKYNCGWFTVEELQQWTEDKGPVVREVA
ncbi:MAG: hypothetical protein ACOCTM_04570 [Bacteroidota bacterium]